MNLSSTVKKVASSVGSYLKGIFKGILGQAGESLETAIKDFVTTDVGAMALAGVEYAATLSGVSNDGLRDAAKAHLVDALKAAGKDLATIGESQLNLFVELALQAWKAHLLGV